MQNAQLLIFLYVKLTWYCRKRTKFREFFPEFSKSKTYLGKTSGRYLL